jgi:hypothetical protein
MISTCLDTGIRGRLSRIYRDRFFPQTVEKGVGRTEERSDDVPASTMTGETWDCRSSASLDPAYTIGLSTDCGLSRLVDIVESGDSSRTVAYQSIPDPSVTVER